MNALNITIIVLHCITIVAGCLATGGIAPQICGIVVAATAGVGTYLQSVANGKLQSTERELRLMKLARTR
jgi:hypothetical protein